MFDATMATRAIGHAALPRPRMTEPALAASLQREEAEQKKEREPKRPKSVAYYCPEWWEHRDFQGR